MADLRRRAREAGRCWLCARRLRLKNSMTNPGPSVYDGQGFCRAYSPRRFSARGGGFLAAQGARRAAPGRTGCPNSCSMTAARCFGAVLAGGEFLRKGSSIARRFPALSVSFGRGRRR